LVRLKLDQEVFGLSALLERLTRTRVLDCFQDKETVYFVVAKGDLGRALGKGGSNIQRIQREFGGKRVKVIEHRNQVESFVRNVIYPIKVEEIFVEEGTVFIKDTRKKTKSLLIGRDGVNLNNIKRAVSRFFNVDVKVV